jgi:hypothetical protein
LGEGGDYPSASQRRFSAATSTHDQHKRAAFAGLATEGDLDIANFLVAAKKDVGMCDVKSLEPAERSSLFRNFPSRDETFAGERVLQQLVQMDTEAVGERDRLGKGVVSADICPCFPVLELLTDKFFQHLLLVDDRLKLLRGAAALKLVKSKRLAKHT